MAAYQFLNPAPVLFVINGTRPAAGGTLSFFDEGTTNERDTWSDPDLVSPGHLNANPIILDAAGRSPVAIWLDGAYTVVLRDSLGDEIWSRVVRSDVSDALSIPALSAGFLTNDLSNLLWQDILLIPDPSGSDTYILSTDGANLIWIPQPETPEPPEPEIVVGANSFQAGISTNTSKFYMQTGSASAPASGTPTTTHSVVFPVAMTTCTAVFITQTSNSQPGGPVVSNTTSISATGFSAQWDVAEASGSGSPDIVNPVPYVWVAIGTLTVP